MNYLGNRIIAGSKIRGIPAVSRHNSKVQIRRWNDRDSMQQSVQLNQGILAWKHAETREMVFFDVLLAGIVLALNSCRPRVEVGGVFVMGWLVSECLCLFAIPPS